MLLVHRVGRVGGLRGAVVRGKVLNKIKPTNKENQGGERRRSRIPFIHRTEVGGESGDESGGEHGCLSKMPKVPKFGH